MSDTVPDDYADYADGQDDARFTERLRDGTLEDAAFRRYLVQDYAFLGPLVGAIGHALGDAPSMAAKGRLADFLGTLTDEEVELEVDFFDAATADERPDAVTDGGDRRW